MPPIAAARFSLIGDGREIASFTQLASISTQAGSVDYISSVESESVFINRFSGVRTSTILKFIRPRSNDARHIAWQLAASGASTAAKKNCFLVLHRTDGKPVARYYLEHAWPTRIHVGVLKGNPGGTSPMETVTMTCEFIQRVSV